MKLYNILKQVWKVAGLIFILLFVTFFLYDYFVNEPKAALVQQELEQEFNAVKPLPQAVACDYHASHKTRQSLVGSSYSTNLTFSEIRAYYDAELTKQGWRFQREKALWDWGRDLGEKSVHYCKGNFTASLEYAGENAGAGWNYALEISWGLGSLYDQSKGNLCE